MTVFELAKKYYPAYWSLERLEALKNAGKLTEEQVDRIAGVAREEDE